MSIEQIQIKRQLERIVREALQRGKNPRIREATRLADFSRLGKPNDYDVMARSDRTLSSEYFNKSMEYYEDDLEVLDIALGEIAEWTEDSRSRYLGRFNAAQNLYERLALKVSVLASAIKSGTSSVFAITEGFDGLEQIDLENTDAYIDTVNGQVTLPKGTDRYTEYSVGNGISIESIDISKDNETWESIPVSEFFEPLISFTSYKDMLYAKYLVHMNSERPQTDDEINPVAIDITIPKYWSKIGTIELRISDDRQNWRSLTSTSDTERKTYVPDGPFEWLEVIIQKYENDQKKVNSDGIIEYIYLPFLSNLIVRAYGYRSSAVLQTKEYTIDPVAEKLGMSAMKVYIDDFKPGDSTIKYFIRLEEGNWAEISNEEIISLAPTTYKDVVKEPIVYREKENALYQVTTELPYSENAFLYEGYNQAELQVAQLSTSNLQLTSWVNRSDLYTQYIDIKEHPFLAGNISYKLYFKVFSPIAKEFSVEDLSIKEEGSLAAIDIDARIVLNKQSLTPKENNDNTFSFNGSLLEGDNYINIILNIPSGDGGRLNIIGNLFTGVDIYCKSRSLASYDSLAYSLPYNDHNYFALDSAGCAILNYMPPKYGRFRYRYQEVNGTIPRSFSFKALLSGSETDTPIIDSFAVTITPPIRR